jgi:TolB-like protein/Tfp pilus assembly protein PilF
VRVYKVLMDSISGYAIRKEKMKEPIAAKKETSSLPDKTSIAVLPFINLSSDPDQEYFADGIAEELLNSLTRISELEVRGRTSSFYFKDKNEDLRTISKMLNVDHILEGSVRKAGQKVRITVQLINTLKDVHLWSETYDRTMDDIFAIQDDIARSVAEAMQITLGVGELGRTPGMTRNIAAYDAYLAGRSLMLQIGRENIFRAIEQLEKAVILDPEFAFGWSYLALIYTGAVDLIPDRAGEFEEKRKAAASCVVTLIPETDLALRVAAILSLDWIEMERLYKKALSLAPDNDNTNFEYAMFLLTVGRPMDAIEYWKRLVRIEPLHSGTYLYLGVTYELIGNSEAAAAAIKKGKELASQHAIFDVGLLALAQEENNRALIDEYLALLVNSELLGIINKAETRDLNQVMQALLDKPEEAIAELKLFMADPAYNNPIRSGGIATWASYFGEHELALQVYKQLDPVFTIWRPIHKEMRQLPEFKDFVREIGLVDYWRKSGKWGDFCHPVGDDDFECD